jgi:hypothetical protein
MIIRTKKQAMTLWHAMGAYRNHYYGASDYPTEDEANDLDAKLQGAVNDPMLGTDQRMIMDAFLYSGITYALEYIKETGRTLITIPPGKDNRNLNDFEIYFHFDEDGKLISYWSSPGMENG